LPRIDLVVAFDFVTSDDDAMIADGLAARDAALAVVGDAEAVDYTITSDEPTPRQGSRRIVRLDYTTPQIRRLSRARVPPRRHAKGHGDGNRRPRPRAS